MRISRDCLYDEEIIRCCYMLNQLFYVKSSALNAVVIAVVCLLVLFQGMEMASSALQNVNTSSNTSWTL